MYYNNFKLWRWLSNKFRGNWGEIIIIYWII